MSSGTWMRVGFTALWAAGLVVFLRLWDLTNLVPPLAGWACVFLLAYAGTVAAVEGVAALRRRGEVVRLAVWAGVIAVALLGEFAVPTVQVRSAMVHTTVFVRIVDTVVPLWIAARAGVLLWKGLTRALVLAGFTAVFFFALWALVVRMPGQSFRGAPPALTVAGQAARTRLVDDVRALATGIGERHYRRPENLAAAATFIEQAFQAAGYQVASQDFVVDGRRFRNLEVVLPGTVRPDEVVVIGAHYDTAEGTLGADDNASGVAVLLELARTWHGGAFARTVKLVAFANEEPPFFGTEGMGSAHYAARAAQRGENVVAMLSLEAVGYFSDAPGSQAYPPPFSLLYPSVGNFIGFVGNLASRPLVARVIAAFRGVAVLPSEGLAAPTGVPGVDWSDQQAFWRHGFAALMITDTAPFRYAHYHYLTDTPDRLDYDRMVRLVQGLLAVMDAVAGGGPRG